MKKWKFSMALDYGIDFIVIAIAILVTFKPQIGEFKFDQSNTMSVMLGFLALDNFISKIIIDKDISKGVEKLQKDVDSLNHGNEIKTRKDFDRLENTYSTAKQTIFVSGLSLNSLQPATEVLKDRILNGVKVRCLTLDPNGKKLEASADMSDVDSHLRKSTILNSIAYLAKEFQNEISAGNMEIKLLDDVIPDAIIGIDIENDGRMIVTNYLYRTNASSSPMFDITKSQTYWYSVYMDQIEKMWNSAVAYKPKLGNEGAKAMKGHRIIKDKRKKGSLNIKDCRSIVVMLRQSFYNELCRCFL